MILKVNKDLSVSPVKSYKNAFIVSLTINVILLFTSMLNLTTEIISVVKDTVTIERTIEDMKQNSIDNELGYGEEYFDDIISLYSK